MTDTDALLSAILANPDDDTPRLVYADALDEAAAERGEPLPCARAEFIRVECELARLKAEEEAQFNEAIDWRLCTGISAVWCPNCGDCKCRLREDSMSDDDCPLHCGASKHCCADRLAEKIAEAITRERAALQGGREWFTAFWSKHLDEWIRGLPGQVPCLSRDEPAVTLGRGNTAVGPPVKYVFERGFVGRVEDCPAADWLQYSESILAAQPIRHVALATWAPFPTIHAAGQMPISWYAVIAGKTVTVTEAEVMEAKARLNPRNMAVLLWRKRWPLITFDPPKAG